MRELRNGCDRCKCEYKVDEFDTAGYPLHVHFCNDCTKQCTNCGKVGIISDFLPKKEHPAYLDWLSTRDKWGNALGLLMGRDLVHDSCMTCLPYQPSVRVTQELVIVTDLDDSVARLEELIK